MKQIENKFDVIVIGGGPAGISAAFWCAELGLRVAILERERELGGQLLWTFGEITNYLGLVAENGRDLCEQFLEQIDNKQVTRFVKSDILSVDLDQKVVTSASADRFSTKNIIIATGVRRRGLGVPGEVEFAGSGILVSGVGSRDEVTGKRVVIVGGGDAALENAMILSDPAQGVTVIHRRDNFSAREDFVKAAKRQANVDFLFNSTVEAIIGNKDVEAVEITDLRNGECSSIEADAVLIRIGVEPNTELFRAQIELDERGYILVSRDCSTGLKGVFAVGDVANPTSPTIATAVGMGATAAKAIKLTY